MGKFDRDMNMRVWARYYSKSIFVYVKRLFIFSHITWEKWIGIFIFKELNRSGGI